MASLRKPKKDIKPLVTRSIRIEDEVDMFFYKNNINLSALVRGFLKQYIQQYEEYAK